MTESERTQMIAELQKYFPNDKVNPSLLHVYGHTTATFRFAVSVDVTTIRREYIMDGLKSLIHLLELAVENMPTEKEVKGDTDSDVP